MKGQGVLISAETNSEIIRYSIVYAIFEVTAMETNTLMQLLTTPLAYTWQRWHLQGS